MGQIGQTNIQQQHPAREGGVLCSEPVASTPKAAGLTGHWPAVAAAFVSGFAVMSLELLEARLMAPYFGTSILVWTNIIGVILVALALGAWLGGIAADKRPRLSTVASFLLLAGVWSIGLALASRPFLGKVADWPLQTVMPLASLLLFAPPSFLLGAVAPAVLRLTVDKLEQSGRIAGFLSAVGTIGSLCGTYVTGYVLLPLLPVTHLVFAIGSLLVLCGLGFSARNRVRKPYAALAAMGMVLVPGLVPAADSPVGGREIPSAYGHVSIQDATFKGGPARFLKINSGYHSAARPDSPHVSLFDYVAGMRAADGLVAEPDSLLLVGAGGMQVADEFAARHPQATVDAIEIDPAVYRAAQEAYGTAYPERVKVIVDDARPAVRRLDRRYGIIAVDAFGGDHCVPWQLLTREAVADYRRALKPGGVLVANMIMPPLPSGEDGKNFQARLAGTFRTGFDWLAIVSMGNGPSPDKVANVLIFAGQGTGPRAADLAREIREKSGVAAAVALPTPEAGEPWTDDAGTADYESLAMYSEAGYW